MHYGHLSDDEVFAFIEVRRDNERRTVGEIVAVVEERRLHLARAFTSMFDFCLRGLGLTEKEAKRRIDAARIVTRFPESFEALASGAVCLSSFVLLKDVLDADNVADLLARANRTKLVEHHSPRNAASNPMRRGHTSVRTSVAGNDLRFVTRPHRRIRHRERLGARLDHHATLRPCPQYASNSRVGQRFCSRIFPVASRTHTWESLPPRSLATCSMAGLLRLRL